MFLIKALFFISFAYSTKRSLSSLQKNSVKPLQRSNSAILLEDYTCPDKPTYTSITDDENMKQSKQYFSCSTNFQFQQQFMISIISIYNCSFSSIKYSGSFQGAIYLYNIDSMMSDFPADESIEIIDTKFYNCTSGSINIQSDSSVRFYNITRCHFEKCKNSQQFSSIFFKGSNGVIESCTFLDNDVTLDGGDIYYSHQRPTSKKQIAADEDKLTVVNNVFVRSNEEHNKGCLFYYENTNGSFEFSGNQINVHESVKINVFNCKDKIEDYSKWSIKSNTIYPLRKDIIKSENANSLPFEESDFEEGPSYDFPVLKCPNQADFDTFIDDVENELSFTDQKVYGCEKNFKNKITTQNCIIGLFYCNFESFTSTAIAINSENPQSQTEKSKIYNCNFNNCEEGCIYINAIGDRKFYDIFNCKFELCNSGSSSASAISFKASNGKIEKCTFRNNIATFGGDIEVNPSTVDASFNRLTITGNTFERTDFEYGRGVFIYFTYKESSRLNLSYNVFTLSSDVSTCLFSCDTKYDNYTQWTFSDNCMYPLKDDQIKDTNAQNLPVDSFDSCTFIDCPPIPDGYEDSQVYFYSCGAVTDDSGGFEITNSVAAIFYSTFSNIIDYDFGAIYISTNIDINEVKFPTKIYNCDFSSCQSDKGGAIYIYSTETSRLYDIHRCTFKDMFLLPENEGNGGAIYIEAKKCNFHISECTFEKNKAGSGGAIYYLSDWKATSRSLLQDDENADYSLSVVDCIFNNNEAKEKGGAICILIYDGETPKPIKIENCTFINNRANESDTGYEDGGAIYYTIRATSSSLLLSNKKPLAISEDFSFCVCNCTFKENYVSYSGGAIYIFILNMKISKPIEIYQCIFDKNHADNSNEDPGDPKDGGTGSDIYYYFDCQNEPANDYFFRISECNFSNSKSSQKGGSLYLTVPENKKPFKPIEVNKCSFIDCTSLKNDAIYFESAFHAAFLHIDDCEFKGLSSVYINAVTCQIENSMFIDIAHPICYECKSPHTKVETEHLKINNCTFQQSKNINSLVYLLSTNFPVFYFLYNNITINNKDTRVFDSPIGFDQLAGKWNFESNWIEPPIGEYLKTKNAEELPAICGTGFFCDIQSPSIEESSLSIEESSLSSEIEISSIQSSDSYSEEPSISESSSEMLDHDYYPGTNCERNLRCKIDEDKEHVTSKFIDISSSNFKGLKIAESGAAIHLINFGITCDDETTFTDCISSEGAGGGIYIKINEPFEYPVLIQNIVFTGCKATHGGAVYVYCNQEEGQIQIISSKFISNEATRTKPINGDPAFGGGAIYMSVKNSNVSNCTFKKNIGSGVKIYNDFESNRMLLKESKSFSSILISNCFFDVDENDSNSLFYVKGKNDNVNVDVIECTFIGKLKNGAHHIDGISLSDKINELNSKIFINSCKFASNSQSAVNKANLPALFALDENSQHFNFTKITEKQVNYKNGRLNLLFVILGCTTVLTFIAFLKKESENNEILEQDSFA